MHPQRSRRSTTLIPSLLVVTSGSSLPLEEEEYTEEVEFEMEE